MRAEDRIKKKKWSKPSMKILKFKDTAGGTFPGYPEDEQGTIS